MSIFSRIKDAIFGGSDSNKSSTTSTRTSAPHPPLVAAGNKPAPASPTAAAPSQAVDVEAVLTARAAQNPQKLNWKTSIVDLMKLLDLDPTLENRKELASELGYTGSTADSASMNIWLHKQVMTKLAQSGGKVPESLKS